MTKKILLLTLMAAFIFSFTGILLAEGTDLTVSKVRYKLDGSDLVTVDITPVTFTMHDDIFAYAPVALYSFSEPLQGTITEMDIEVTVDGMGTLWYCENTEQTLNQYFSGDGDPNTGSGIAVTNNTTEIYVGMRVEAGEAPQIVSPGTE